MKHLWNKHNPNDKIKANNDKKIWNELKIKLSSSCNKESCWWRKLSGKNNSTRKLGHNSKGGRTDDLQTQLDFKNLQNYTWAPKSPKSWKEEPNTWLNSDDIERVMNQYKHKYPCFDFIGPTPIDFDGNYDDGFPVSERLKKFNIINEMKNKKNKIGIIFNLDPHYKDGSHWVAMFINIKKGVIYYFDSNGDTVPMQVKKLVDRIREQGQLIGKKFIFKENTREHQREDTECGIYTLYFIIKMLKDTPFSYFDKNRVKDKAMMNLRTKYFNQSD